MAELSMAQVTWEYMLAAGTGVLAAAPTAGARAVCGRPGFAAPRAAHEAEHEVPQGRPHVPGGALEIP
eukprot:CAMPEP_0194595820 /NCGR_PEP_ID=MMETSP0292-20121207/25240_1 /TAXON_ID=39354 /ORGANISM="Heterosigma akashiwo, Strain CCMP2393" /LENGTH=67 /DNA_ID=CAMNT_0039455861 /DNA_START=609 /DNA_END=810 /DNA_ORIENTATION=-